MAMRSSREDPQRARSGEESLTVLAITVAKEVTTLARTELKLLRTEIAEKLTATGISAAFVGVGTFLVLATLVLLLQAAIAALVAYGFTWLAAIVVVAGITLVAGVGLLWAGMRGLRAERLAPSKTLNQLQKDANMAQGDKP
jgi:uncharacterized membrane protein YqjE